MPGERPRPALSARLGDLRRSEAYQARHQRDAELYRDRDRRAFRCKNAETGDQDAEPEIRREAAADLPISAAGRSRRRTATVALESEGSGRNRRRSPVGSRSAWSLAVQAISQTGEAR